MRKLWRKLTTEMFVGSAIAITVKFQKIDRDDEGIFPSSQVKYLSITVDGTMCKFAPHKHKFSELNQPENCY